VHSLRYDKNFSQLSNIADTEPSTLHSCKIMKIKDAHNGIELHDLLHIKPASAAKWFIGPCAIDIHN